MKVWFKKFIFFFPVEVEIPSSPKPNSRVAPETGADGVAGLSYFFELGFMCHYYFEYR